MPERYRGVAVTAVPTEVGLGEDALRALLLGRPAYRKTRFVVARCDGRTALLRVTRPRKPSCSRRSSRSR